MGTLFIAGLSAQDAALPESQLSKTELETHLRFLASDALMGRRTSEPGNDVAAAYLAAYFEAHGLETVPGQDDYFQEVPMTAVTPPTEATLTLNENTVKQGGDLLIMSGNADGLKGNVVFAEYGWVDEDNDYDDYQGKNVKGKIVFVLPGTPESQDPMAIFGNMGKKQAWAQERGAIALIELYSLPFPWAMFQSFFGKETISLSGNVGVDGADLVYGWVKMQSMKEELALIKQGKRVKGSLMSIGYVNTPVRSQNVIAVLPGTDPELKDEYVVITAHYDHVGTGKNGGNPFSPEDSIFNGARDNAMGTVALMAAAKTLSIERPKRSVVFLAVTGEELGLLGSRYYADHPLIPLEKTIFNLNTDGAGYNDKSYLSVVGYGRTGTDGEVEEGTEAFGLKVFPNPAPEQGLFDRSDNVSFAQKGVPALCVSPGLTQFDETVGRYYHQVADNPSTIDYDYLHQYCQAFARIARLITNKVERPWWAEGDKYEAAGEELYKE